MQKEGDKKAKPLRTYALTPKAIIILDQLHKESGMNKSEIVNKLIVDYNDSIKKKICP